MIRAALICCAAALMVVGVAGATASSVSYPDPAGDAGKYPDIVRVDVLEDQTFSGPHLTFWATFSATQPCGDSGGPPVVFALDLDQNPDTGSAFYGAEAELTRDQYGSPLLLRSIGWDFAAASPQPDSGFGAGCGPDGAGFDLHRSDLGLAPGAGFNVVAVVASPHTDSAPDMGTFNYPGAGSPPSLGPDKRAPHIASVFPARAVHGKLARLTYWTLDGRGRTAETIRVYRRNRVIATIRRPLGETNPFDLTHVSWRVPGNVRGKLRFSVVSLDAAGNRSSVRWGQLSVR
ncbi:MAG TPA: hypothetical protein VIW19_06670 [Gaiellaceae bacterium]|jgi:hypothetical protein